jgi:riboflavin kinase/FMN adenylyltransferase
MQRWRGLDAVPSGWGRCVATIGVYDGMHRGHQAIVGRVVERAREAGLPAVVIMFDPNPAEVVRPGPPPATLSTIDHRADLLADLGVDVLLVMPFTVEFSRLTPEEFVHRALVGRLHAAAVVVGENFRFGHKAAGDVGLLAELGNRFGFAVEGVGLYGEADTTLSSTYVRACLDAGDVEAAVVALGRPHRVEGVVVPGDNRGHDLGFPTANLDPVPHAAIPADGIYAGQLVCGDERLAAAISIGTNPTFHGSERRVEAYALDRDDLDLYGEHVAVDFVARLRSTEGFDSTEALVAQMDEDVRRTREVLDVPSNP